VANGVTNLRRVRSRGTSSLPPDGIRTPHVTPSVRFYSREPQNEGVCPSPIAQSPPRLPSPAILFLLKRLNTATSTTLKTTATHEPTPTGATVRMGQPELERPRPKQRPAISSFTLMGPAQLLPLELVTAAAEATAHSRHLT